MSILTPLTKLALIGGAGGLLYMTALQVLPGAGAQAPIEQGFENPSHVEFSAPKNEKGNREFYLTYDNGQLQLALPIRPGPNGPLVGSPDYYWNNLNKETQSQLVAQSWSTLELETRTGILKGELEQLLEIYSRGEVDYAAKRRP